MSNESQESGSKPLDLEEIRRLRDQIKLPSLSAEELDELLDEENPGSREPLSQERVADLLSNRQFGQYVAEAISRTDRIYSQGEEQRQLQYGREFGFAVSHIPNSSDRNFYFSQLIEGYEDHITSRDQLMDLMISSSNGVDIQDVIFFLHTHPTLVSPKRPGESKYNSLSRSIQEMGRASKGRILRLNDHFSPGDFYALQGQIRYKLLAPNSIFALGTLDHEDPRKGHLLMVTFHSADSLRNFDPSIFGQRPNKISDQYQGNILAGIGFKLYQANRLNVAELNVNLSSKTPLNASSIQRASRILTGGKI